MLIHLKLRSVASTRPAAPTFSANHRTTDPPPAPISRHLQPGATPRSLRCRNVVGSSAVSRPENLPAAWSDALSKRYPLSVIAPPCSASRETLSLRSVIGACGSGPNHDEDCEKDLSRHLPQPCISDFS